MFIIDAHEDITMNSVIFGRDYSQSAATIRTQEADSPTAKLLGQAMLGWPNWIEGEVGLVFGSMFVPPAREDRPNLSPHSYSNPEEAHEFYHKQLAGYQQLVLDHPDKFTLIETQSDLDDHLTAWEMDDPSARQLGIVLLMEGAEGIREPSEVKAWYEAGVRIIGPAWSQTRYAGGTGQPGPLTELGRALLDSMATFNLILDLTHLTDEGAHESLDRYPGPIVATHSNPRALLDDDPKFRQLPDGVIRKLADRDGVMGIVMANPFLQSGLTWTDTETIVPLARVVDHIDYVCQLTGSADHVGIGTDFDGGFGAEITPQGLDTVADLSHLALALDKRGYDEADIEAIMMGNWLRLLHDSLPE